MAPFTFDGSLIYARSVIKDLGDFSLIRSPAKCAARIGQTFSQTFSAIAIPAESFKTMSDVERNGRTFSDGVGTCSHNVLQKIWDGYSQARGLKPTVFQIRFRGKFDPLYHRLSLRTDCPCCDQVPKASSRSTLDFKALLCV